jgi:hypothetical protein
MKKTLLVLMTLPGLLNAMTPEEKIAKIQKIKIDFFKIARAHDSLERSFVQNKQDTVARWHGLTVGPFYKHLASQSIPKAAWLVSAKMYGHYSNAIHPIEVTRINDLPAQFTDEDRKAIRSLNEVEFETVKKGMRVEGLFLADIAQDRVDRFCAEEIKDCKECELARKNLENLHAFFSEMDQIRYSK